MQTQLDPIEKDEELNILLIGNSLSVDTCKYAAKIAAAAGYTNVTIGNCKISGATMNFLWEATNPQELASEETLNFLDNLENPYTCTCTNTTAEGTTITTSSAIQCSFNKVMADSEWDIVIFNERSNFAGIPDGTLFGAKALEVNTGKYLINFKNYIHNIYPDAKIGYEQTWAYDPAYEDSVFAYFNNDHDEMFQDIVLKTSAIWNDSEIDLILPAGTAFENARTSYLAGILTRDGKHASYDYGRILAAMTFLSSCGLDLSSVSDLSLGSHSISSLHMNLLKACVSDALADPATIHDQSQTVTPALSAPVLNVQTSDSYIKIKWKAVSGATGYLLQRLSKTGTYKTVKSYKAGSSTYTYRNSLNSNGYYRYQVIAVGDSVISNTPSGSFTTLKIQTPSKLTGTNYSTSIKLSWKKQTGVTGYLVYRCKPGGTYKKCAQITSASKTTFTDTAVNKSGRYKYRVRSYLKFNGKCYYGKYAYVSVKK